MSTLVAHRVGRASIRIGSITAMLTFVILGGGDLLVQWIAGYASPAFMLGTLLINAGLCTGNIRNYCRDRVGTFQWPQPDTCKYRWSNRHRRAPAATAGANDPRYGKAGTSTCRLGLWPCTGRDTAAILTPCS